MPRVAVLMPTYESNLEYLHVAVESLFTQTEKDWALLIHDDCSTKDVQAMLRPEWLADPRVTFKRSAQRLGIGGNWNACVRQAAAAPAVQFLFQDDWWEPRYLEKTLEILDRHPNVGIVSVEHAYPVEGGMTAEAYERLRAEKRTHLRPGEQSGTDFLRWWLDRGLHPNVVGEPSFVMVRRELLARCGLFLEDMPQFLDSEYWTRCLLQTHWYYLTEELGSFRVHPQAASARNEASGAGIVDRLRTFELIISALPGSELKTTAVRARNRALTDMARKFFGRVKGGKSVGGAAKNKNFLIRFALRHPVTTSVAIARAMGV